jgi:hypothetical protein
MLWDEALKEVQNELQLQKERSDMFMSFLDGETNKVDICKILRELEQLQQQINERDVIELSIQYYMMYWIMMYPN